MAFKRKGAEEPSPQGDVKIVDELVKKSLAINPAMRRGKDTQKILEQLRAEAAAGRVEESPAPSVAAGLPLPKRKHQDPRLQTLAIFMGQKASELPGVFNTLTEQRRALEEDYHRKLGEIDAQVKATQREVLAEIVDMVRVLMASGAKPHDCQQALGDFREVFKLLQINEGAVMELARGSR